MENFLEVENFWEKEHSRVELRKNVLINLQYFWSAAGFRAVFGLSETLRRPTENFKVLLKSTLRVECNNEAPRCGGFHSIGASAI